MLLPKRKSESSFHSTGEIIESLDIYDQENEDDDEQNDKFLSIPFVENDENDEESINRRMTATRLSRIVGVGVIFAVIAAFGVALAYYIHDDDHKTSDIVLTNVCYEEPSCTNIDIKQVYDPSTGFTNNTGFNGPSIHSNACCNICPAGLNSTVCFKTVTGMDEYRNLWTSPAGTSSTSNCSEKTGNADYDYVMLDQIYYPQLCNALLEGHDPTLSHLSGTQCTKETTSSAVKMNIHGLWPNYYHGYPQCCRGNSSSEANTTSVSTLNPSDVQTWKAYSGLEKFWYDPTTALVNADAISCSTCYLLNHEWQKHGSCYSPEQQEAYFASGLEIHIYLTNATRAIEAMNSSVVSTADIEAMYLHRVNVICDPLATAPSTVIQTVGDVGVGVFLELQTCWTVDIVPVTSQHVLQGTHDSRGAQVTVISDKRTGRFLARSISELKELLMFEEESPSLSEQLEGKEIADFTWVDCSAASASHFTTPCPSRTYVGTYDV